MSLSKNRRTKWEVAATQILFHLLQVHFAVTKAVRYDCRHFLRRNSLKILRRRNDDYSGGEEGGERRAS